MSHFNNLISQFNHFYHHFPHSIKKNIVYIFRDIFARTNDFSVSRIVEATIFFPLYFSFYLSRVTDINIWLKLNWVPVRLWISAVYLHVCTLMLMNLVFSARGWTLTCPNSLFYWSQKSQFVELASRICTCKKKKLVWQRLIVSCSNGRLLEGAVIALACLSVSF